MGWMFQQSVGPMSKVSHENGGCSRYQAGHDMGNAPPADELTHQGHLCFLTMGYTTQHQGTHTLVSSALQARGRGVAQHFISSRPECYKHLNTHQSGGPEALPKGWGGSGDFLQDLASSFRLSSSGRFLYLLKYNPIFFDHDSEDSVPGLYASPRLCSHREDPPPGFLEHRPGPQKACC